MALAAALAAVSDRTACCCCHRQATEYYYDEGAKQLYYFSNATHGAPPTETFVAVRVPLIPNTKSFFGVCAPANRAVCFCGLGTDDPAHAVQREPHDSSWDSEALAALL